MPVSIPHHAHSDSEDNFCELRYALCPMPCAILSWQVIENGLHDLFDAALCPQEPEILGI
jgi:hypothetical protein